MPEYAFTFSAFAPHVKRLRTDKGYRIEMDVPEDDYQPLGVLASPMFDGKRLKVTVELVMDAKDVDAGADRVDDYTKAHKAHEAAIAEWCRAGEGRTRDSYKAGLIEQGTINKSLSELTAEQHRAHANLIHLELSN